MEGLCGRDCETCAYREQLNCGGCRTMGRCPVAVCCREKGHETCGTCTQASYCGLRRSGAGPEARLREQEVLQDRLNLQAQFGRIVRGMAYPYGSWSDAVVDCLRACGIAYARTTASTGRFDVPTDWLRMPATCHHGDARLPELTSRFLEMKPGDKPQLFYLWGHSYEFTADDNWELIEEFCRFIGGRDDIWYAANIEIVDYMKAARNLKFTVDGDLVYNPGALSVWVSVEENGEKKMVEVGAGQTVRL